MGYGEECQIIHVQDLDSTIRQMLVAVNGYIDEFQSVLANESVMGCYAERGFCFFFCFL